MKDILNLTRHPATPAQIAEGVRDMPAGAQEKLRGLLTFEQAPEADEMERRAAEIAVLACEHVRRKNSDYSRGYAMVSGAPYFMLDLVTGLKRSNIICLHSFSRREAVEETQADGSVRKVMVFKHDGWVEM